MLNQLRIAVAIARAEGPQFWLGALSLPLLSISGAGVAFVVSIFLKG